jgi:hypothetical protein
MGATFMKLLADRQLLHIVHAKRVARREQCVPTR